MSCVQAYNLVRYKIIAGQHSSTASIPVLTFPYTACTHHPSPQCLLCNNYGFAVTQHFWGVHMHTCKGLVEIILISKLA